MSRWGFTATITLVAGILGTTVELASCTHALDGAVVAANSAAELGDRTERILADAYRREQDACISDTDREPEALLCVHTTRARYRTAWRAYDDFRKAWLATTAAVQAAQAA